MSRGACRVLAMLRRWLVDVGIEPIELCPSRATLRRDGIVESIPLPRPDVDPESRLKLARRAVERAFRKDPAR